MKQVNVIAAVAKNRAIGYQNKLLYWLPNDLKRFKTLTTGHTIIMGRRTFESLPKGALPNRRNIVLSRTEKSFDGCECYKSLEEALQHCDEDEIIYIIGGASVYKQAMPFAQRLCLTEIDDTPENADAFFPDYHDWTVEMKEEHEKDEKHAFNYAFVDYVKDEKKEKRDCRHNNISTKLLLTLFLVCQSLFVSAQRHEIFHPNITSLQVKAGYDWLSLPIINLHDDKPINFDFDDLTHEYHRYMYKVEHCEADWTTSEEIFVSDFVNGFNDRLPIDDVEESLNTTVLYTHYHFQVPNDQCKLIMSGNYRVTVYDENDDDEPMFSACFMVVNPLMNISMSVSGNTEIDIYKSHQQITMGLGYGSLSVTHRDRQIKTVVMQNGRWDNAKINVKPQYEETKGLKWENNRNLIFDGGNEYRKFETLDVTHTTMGLESVSWDGNNYHAYVWTDEPRRNYVYDEDANGAFLIRNSDNYEIDRICDYVHVHFKLKVPQYYGDVYLNGQWTNDQFLPQYKMEFDAKEMAYNIIIPLKQGYYSYQYLLMKDDGTLIPVPSEGNFYQTENKYQALVYYREIGGRTDQLVGFSEVSCKF